LPIVSVKRVSHGSTVVANARSTVAGGKAALIAHTKLAIFVFANVFGKEKVDGHLQFALLVYYWFGMAWLLWKQEQL
jgi:hypothetical protein